MNDIVERALAARTIADIDELERRLQAAGANTTRYLGDNMANFSTLSHSADPCVLIFERITNAIDGVVERELLRQGVDPATLRSPAEAARQLLGTPRGGMTEISSADRRRLGAEVELALRESDDSRRTPTITIRDYGIGISRADAPGTILSLEANNKLSKFYAHGVFGKGGSLACAFSDATVYIMRRQPDLLRAGEADMVTVAIVRKEDRAEYRLPFYRYLVMPSTEDARGLPYAADAADADFKPGVYVAHINFDARQMGTQNWNQEGSVYAFAETLLFRPTLPYSLRDARPKAANVRPPGREQGVLAGLGARLDNLKTTPGGADDDKAPSVIKRGGPSTINIPDVGKVQLRWQLFDTQDKRRSYLAKGYSVIFTHDGQVHHSWSASKFNDKVKHRRVADRIFVEVDTSDLPTKLCSTIFSSYRDQVRSVKEAEALEDAVVTWLKKDEDLRDMEALLVRETFKTIAQEMSAGFLDRLNRAILAKLPTISIIGTGNGNGTPPRPKKKKPDELGPEPTYISAPATLSIVPGNTQTFYLTTNAEDGFIPDRAVPELDPAVPELVLSYGYLSAGRLQLSIAADTGAKLGPRAGNLRLSFMARAGGLKQLDQPFTVNVVDKMPVSGPAAPPTGGTGGTTTTEQRQKGMFALRWSKTESEDGWTDETAGDLQMIPGTALAEEQPTIYAAYKDVTASIPTLVINENFRLWNGYARGLSASDTILKGRRDDYALSLGVAIAELWTREDKLVDQKESWERRGKTGDEPVAAMNDAQRQRAVSTAARGIISVLPSFDRIAAAVA